MSTVQARSVREAFGPKHKNVGLLDLSGSVYLRLMNDFVISRRALLGGIGASMAAPAVALEPAEAVRPRLLNGAVSTLGMPSVEGLIEKAKLGGRVAFAVGDARTGELLETRSHLVAMPPASVAKALTALYALEHLGPDYRYRTKLFATGAVVSGRLEGDLILQASGDPVLSSDDLGDMAAAVKAAGIQSISGQFLVAIPGFAEQPQIDRSQPFQVSYNPGVAGLNLNFNRVHFEWKRSSGGHDITMQARARRFRPASATSTMEIVDRHGPVYEFERSGGIDKWTVARNALGSKGARWLPVRAPVDYALDAFAVILKANGIELPRARRVTSNPTGQLIFESISPPLSSLLKQMLKVSTNLTAEIVGQTATLKSGQAPATIRASARAMSQWLADVSSARRPRLVDHSGLGDANDISPRDMVAALSYAGPDNALAGLMKPWKFKTSDLSNQQKSVNVSAKAGTLNFVSGLAGYVVPASGRPLAFAIFSANEERRNALTREERERPPGAKSWSRRARALNSSLLQRWTDIHT